MILGGVSVLAATAPARAASSVEVSTSNSVQVTAVAGFAFTPNAITYVATNTSITVTFTDADVQDHTFTVIGREGWVIPNDASGETIDELAYGSQYPALFSVNASAAGGSGDQITKNFTSPGIGWYEFVCTESGHFQNGMYGFIAFGEALPGNLTVVSPDTDPGAAVFIIVGTIVTLVVIALVLGFVVGRRRGDAYEMPPQRLGYAEPDLSMTPSTPLAPTEPRG
jgi:plastocyanin